MYKKKPRGIEVPAMPLQDPESRAHETQRGAKLMEIERQKRFREGGYEERMYKKKPQGIEVAPMPLYDPESRTHETHRLAQESERAQKRRARVAKDLQTAGKGPMDVLRVLPERHKDPARAEMLRQGLEAGEKQKGKFVPAPAAVLQEMLKHEKAELPQIGAEQVTKQLVKMGKAAPTAATVLDVLGTRKRETGDLPARKKGKSNILEVRRLAAEESLRRLQSKKSVLGGRYIGGVGARAAPDDEPGKRQLYTHEQQRAAKGKGELKLAAPQLYTYETQMQRAAKGKGELKLSRQPPQLHAQLAAPSPQQPYHLGKSSARSPRLQAAHVPAQRPSVPPLPKETATEQPDEPHPDATIAPSVPSGTGENLLGTERMDPTHEQLQTLAQTVPISQTHEVNPAQDSAFGFPPAAEAVGLPMPPLPLGPSGGIEGLERSEQKASEPTPAMSTMPTTHALPQPRAQLEEPVRAPIISKPLPTSPRAQRFPNVLRQGEPVPWEPGLDRDVPTFGPRLRPTQPQRHTPIRTQTPALVKPGTQRRRPPIRTQTPALVAQRPPQQTPIRTPIAVPQRQPTQVQPQHRRRPPQLPTDPRRIGLDPPRPEPSSPDDSPGGDPRSPRPRRRPRRRLGTGPGGPSGGPSGRGGKGGSGTGGVGTGGGASVNLNIGGFGGGGGASASASAAAGGATGAGAGGAQQAGLLLAALTKKKKKQSGITAAKKRYTDKRKVKLGELRALKSKRLREHKARTKKMPKANRDKARAEFKKKVDSQYKEVTKRFPTARGLRDLQTVRSLIDKIDRVRLPS